MPPVDAFIGAGGMSDGLIAITDYAILIADVEPAVAKTLASRLTDGTMDDLPNAKRIELSSLSSVQSNKHGQEVTLKHWDGKTTQMTLATFADPATRDRALAVLQRRFGRSIRREETQFGLVRAIGVPLLWTIGIALFTWICVEAARELAGGASISARHAVRPRTALFAAVLTLVGPFGAFVFGALATAAAGRWTYRRWRQPPLMVRLIRI